MATSKLKVNRGTTYTITLNYKKNGVASSLVGATVYFTVKAAEYDTSATDTTALISKTITSHTDAAGGITTITLSNVDTYIEPATYYYDIKVKEAGGAIYKVDEGLFTVDGSPTNRTT